MIITQQLFRKYCDQRKKKQAMKILNITISTKMKTKMTTNDNCQSQYQRMFKELKWNYEI